MTHDTRGDLSMSFPRFPLCLQSNYIKTSKYSLLTFLPLNLLEQFQRLANFYFLCLLILQLIPAISSLTPVTTAIPLIGVLTLTAIKDAYDDFQRHVSDSQVNNRISKCLRGGKLVDEKWSGVQVRLTRLRKNKQKSSITAHRSATSFEWRTISLWLPTFFSCHPASLTGCASSKRLSLMAKRISRSSSAWSKRQP